MQFCVVNDIVWVMNKHERCFLNFQVETVLEGLILSPDGLDIPVDEVRIVGSYKKGTLLAGHPVADLVVILKELPTGIVKITCVSLICSKK